MLRKACNAVSTGLCDAVQQFDIVRAVLIYSRQHSKLLQRRSYGRYMAPSR
jgi:hypothetical protein